MALDDILSVKAFGAMGDMKGTAGRDKGTVSVSGPKVILIADKPVFVPEDNRKAIVIWDGNINTREDPLVTKINSVDPDKRTVGLDHPPTKNMDNMSFAWGTDDTDAIQKTLDKAKERGLAVYLPPGHFIVTRALKYITDLVKNDERDKGISYVPNPKLMADHAGQFEVLPVMKPGLRMFGAGMQVSFLHNLITSDSLPDYPPADYPSPRATIIIDGTQGKKIINSDKEAKSWQQTGELRDFHITATGHIKNTVGIDLLATWAYTIKNVAIMNMGSHGIIIRNRLVEGTSADYDQTDKLHLDNVFLFRNEGWGIFVDAAELATSTSKIHIERCKIEQNMGGGINWTGIGGIIEQCGVYANGVLPLNIIPKQILSEDDIPKYSKREHDPITNPGEPLKKPTYVSGAHGILIKNVKGTSNGLLITGCEIQGNADIQVMVEVGANIRIVQNDFKDDDQSPLYTFPAVDIQVGDGNKGAGKGPRNVTGCVIEDNRIRVNWKDGWGMYKTPLQIKAHKPKHTVVKVNTNAINTVIGRWWTEQFEEDEDGAHKLVELVEEFKTGPTGKNSTYTKNMLDRRVHLNTYLHRSGVDAFHQGGHVLLPFATEQKNIKEPTEEYTPDTSRWCNYRFRLIDKVEVLNLKNPTTRTIGTPLFLEFVNGRTDGSSVLVKFGDEYGIRDLRIPPVKAVTGILLFGIDSIWTPFSPWTCQGSPLISPHIIDVNDDMLKTPAEKISYKATYIPNESGWNSYHFIISQNIKSLKLGKTTVHTVGAQLFLNFVNNRSEPVIVTFDNEYAAGKGIMLSPNEVVSGIMLFDETNRWRLYTPWSCEGIPLRGTGKPPTSTMM